ncbi:MAG TPA: hypothetical protein PLT82_03870 [Candidatus Hydrogenedens sp.]|nr:hypothetical protein [Candidatus Hydrogenedens sp.]HOL19422.1 hypothetical protein [Candidatus Hydrogenedens sp.]HPP58251.1 hypothetical protein [Candidatus Hydrogenedens sp.]
MKYYSTFKIVISFLFVLFALQWMCGANECLKEVNELPSFEGIPNPFQFCDGKKVETVEDWRKRREEIKEILMFYEYGHLPPAPKIQKSELLIETTIFDDKALYREYAVYYGPPEFKLDVMMFLPVSAKEKPSPVILFIPKFWKENDDNKEIAKKCIERGYALCLYDKSVLDDDSGSRDQMIYKLYPECDWGSLGVWGWGALRVLDFLETIPEVNTKQLALTGHSRRGKASMWASANDERIPLVIPQSSGTGGCGSYRIVGKGAETLRAITTDVAPYWFVPRLKDFIGKEDRLPFDQHFLKALIAPRGQLSREALGDLWANPMGTQVMHECTVPVYQFLGATENIGIHYREGEHALQPSDWDVVLDFADHFFFKKKPPEGLNKLPFKDTPKPDWTVPDTKSLSQKNLP